MTWLQIGDRHYRAYVGPPEKYDIVAAMQFNLLTFSGLKEHHKVVDIGCGSLRAGRLLIPYLKSGNYLGIEPEEWLVQEGIAHELGEEIIRLKKPTFIFSKEFPANQFGIFDYAIAQSIFSHATQDQIKLCLRNVSEGLDDEGLFFATFISGFVDYVGASWAYPECITYRPETLRHLASKFNLDFRTIEWPHPNGQTWGVFGRQERISEMLDPTFINYPVEKAVNSVNILEDCEGTGWFDNAVIIGNKLHVRGWARNPDTGRPPNYVLIMNQDNQIIATIRTSEERPDVAEAFQSRKLLLSGWDAWIDLPLTETGEYKLKAYVYHQKSNTAMRIPQEYLLSL